MLTFCAYENCVDRKYYLKENFKILKLAIAEKIYGK